MGPCEIDLRLPRESPRSGTAPAASTAANEYCRGTSAMDMEIPILPLE